MLNKLLSFEKNEIYSTQYLIWFIVNFLYKQNGKVNFEDIFWIINKANKIMLNKYLVDKVDIEIFNSFNFPKKITPNLYKITEISLNEQPEFISKAQIKSVEESCNKWKYYGKYFVKIKLFFFERIKK